MESNFIKERVVVRQQIIKKNLKESGDGSKSTPANTSHENPPDRVVALEEVVNEKLKQDLVEVSKQVDRVCETIADYHKVKSALKCHIEDATQIYLCVGKDYFLKMDLDEALKMIDFKEKQWMRILDELQKRASAIKAYIKIALEAMGKVYDVDRDKLTSADI